LNTILPVKHDVTKLSELRIRLAINKELQEAAFMNRVRLLIIGLAAVVVLAAVTFPLWRPLFVNTVVSEDFPQLSGEQQAAFNVLPPEQQSAFVTMAAEDQAMADAMVAAALAPDAVMTEAPTALSNGAFGVIDAIHGGEGTATIYALADGSRVLRFEDFRVTNGPDLHVYLARNDAPRSHDDLGDDYIDLGSLKGNVGNQNYTLPAELDLSGYQSVVIYCVPFQVVFSTATLAPA
jgi:hypothetical protein